MSARLPAALRLYAITPDGLSDAAAYAAAVTEAIAGGATAVQFRDKSARTPEERRAIAQAIGDVCSQAGVLFVVNDDAALALAVAADAVHVGPEDASVREVRALVGPDVLIGGSAGSVEAGRALVAAGADYLGVGAIFDARATKPNASAPKGVALLQAMRADAALAGVPIVAIGGIDASNAASCLRAGADGVATVRAVFGGGDVRAATARLAVALRGWVG